MRNFLTSLFRRRGRGDNAVDRGAELPRPEAEVVVIGDIHGRADLLRRMIDKVQRDTNTAQMVFVGDYVDRGPDSRAVLEVLRDLGPAAECLKGNHEAMLVEFLDHPIERGPRWLRNGGTQTLASYGIDIQTDASADKLIVAADAFRVKLGNARDWLNQRPIHWRSGNLWVVHAGPDPKAPIPGQNENAFLWGHNRFLRDQRTDGQWVAHGHWVVDQASIQAGRIAVDTGAWKTGRLSAAHIRPDGSIRFFTA